jgi:hypothetical protein
MQPIMGKEIPLTNSSKFSARKVTERLHHCGVGTPAPVAVVMRLKRTMPACAKFGVDQLPRWANTLFKLSPLHSDPHRDGVWHFDRKRHGTWRFQPSSASRADQVRVGALIEDQKTGVNAMVTTGLWGQPQQHHIHGCGP